MARFRIQSELTERQIEADVASYFGWISPEGERPFRLLDIDEQLTGADKLFDRIIPIYMQFKVSHGLSASHSVLPAITPLQRIRKFRKNHELHDNPTLYFKLRDKAKHAEDFQHNILMRFCNDSRSHAFYVAPLTLQKDEYERELYGSLDRYLHDPFVYRTVSISQEKWISYLGHIPFLRAHISISPHEKVDTSEHYYSFSRTGSEIAWHSPNIISKDVSRLSDRCKFIFSAFWRPELWYATEEFMTEVSGRIADLEIDINRNDNQPAIERILMFGRQLNLRFRIRQMLLCTTSEFLQSFRLSTTNEP